MALASLSVPASTDGAKLFDAYVPQLDSVAADLTRSGASPELDFALRFFPVYDLKRQTLAAVFCTPAPDCDRAEPIFGHKNFHDVALSDWPILDCAILEHAVLLAARLAASEVVVAVGASVTFGTLCDPIGRRLYREALRAMNPREKAHFLLKVEEIPDQTDLTRIVDIVSQVRPLASRVWVHLPNSRMLIGARDDLHASGLVLSLPARLTPYGVLSEARWLVDVAKRQKTLACMEHVDSATDLEMTRRAGIRFAAGHALHRPSLPSRVLSS